MEMPGIEPGASYMQSMRSTTELHPQLATGEAKDKTQIINIHLTLLGLF